MKRIAIIGGGISGLSAAFTLERQQSAGLPLEYVLFEASPRCGGVILTERVEDCLIEGGPDSFLTEKPWAEELCRQVGLGDQLIGSNDSQRRTYVLVNGRLIPMPDGLAFMVPTKILPMALSPLFSLGTKARMAREWFLPAAQLKTDESVSTFIERHYGKEMVDRLADPLLSGVYGGAADQLGVQAVLPRFADMQARVGSLGRAMVRNRKLGIKKEQRPLFMSLKDGMQQFVDAILLHLSPSCLRANSPIEWLRRCDDGWAVSSEPKSLFDSVIIAVPPRAAASLLDQSGPSIASELRRIQCSSSVTVSLGYDQKVRDSLPTGFGFLVPRTEGKRLLAATLVHNKFPHRAPEDRALIRCFLGGTRDESILERGEDEILGIVNRELLEILGINVEPLFARLYKWKASLAQYNVGHVDRLSRIEEFRRQLPGIFLAGNAYDGIGVPDCVRSGKQAAMAASAVT